MSKLDDILTKGPLISPDLRSELKQAIKDLVLELLGEQDIAALFDNNGGIKRFGRPDATARNDLRNEIRQRIQAL